MTRFLLPAWIVVSVLLFLYSFTQVSLSLALNKSPFLYSIQQTFQYIGYFNRPLSVGIYGVILILLWILYGTTIYFVSKKKINAKNLGIIILCVVGILTFSYNAFSHDIFNYIFDAKIVTYYQENPYLKKALDFPGDPMLSFMQWTHRTYPYGPVWLAVSIPFSYAGLQYFLITFYLFKLLATISFLVTAWFIYKIVELQNKKYALLATAFFALNPLMIIEFLVSSHNDILMLTLAVISVYLLLKRKIINSGILFLLSVGVKYATAFLAPMMGIILLKPQYFEKAVYIGIGSMIGAIIAASIKSGNFQPWYFSYVVVLAALVSFKKYIGVPVALFSFFACLYYIPYLYTGSWDSPIPTILAYGLSIAVICSIIVYAYFIFMSLRKRSKV